MRHCSHGWCLTCPMVKVSGLCLAFLSGEVLAEQREQVLAPCAYQVQSAFLKLIGHVQPGEKGM